MKSAKALPGYGYGRMERRTDGRMEGRTDNAKTISLRLWRGKLININTIIMSIECSPCTYNSRKVPKHFQDMATDGWKDGQTEGWKDGQTTPKQYPSAYGGG
ncbi:hypothetical protein DPMN_172884 [Dreissena polymorpha]|uniref:Uncharacterized protein n=1 Tax=Dreissena polymorpha TaxID=45954 RepID=A0A9D4IF07_DREPO|nr:hypothetical protein DPMN_172884 [Dreissena polymorpha]